jgi:hypothetical protein
MPWLMFYDPRQLRNLWLADMTRIMERTLRSQAFLEAMQFNFRLMCWLPLR